MSAGAGGGRRRDRPPRRGAAARVGMLLLSLVGVAVLAGGTTLVVATLVLGQSSASAAASPSPTRTPLPVESLDPADLLLAETDLPGTCAVSFVTDAGTAAAADPGLVPPRLEVEGQLFSPLPIPRRTGEVFAGWYATPAAAAAHDPDARANGAKPVVCTDRRLTLYGSWLTAAESAAAGTKVPILMYHQFTDKPGGESGWLRLNYIYTGDFAQQMSYIADQKFYLPTWDELDAFIDGTLYLPPKSVIVTDDDADPTWLSMGVPIVTQRHVLTTSFVITVFRNAPSPSPYVLQRSHTHDMHRAGANGKGRMVNESHDVIVADLEQSATILGAKEVIAYPFGHYNATAEQAVHDAGFDMAVTIEGGYVKPGSNKLALPRVRMDYGTTMTQFIAAIG